MPETFTPGRYSKPIVIASAAAYCIGNLSWWMQPEIVHDVIGRFHVGEAAGGLVASAETATVALSTILSAKAIGHVRFRTLAVGGTVAALLGMLLSVLASSYGLLVFARLLTGLGEGVPLAVSGAALAGFADPDRAYSRINVANAAMGVGALSLIAAMRDHLGYQYAALPAVMIIVLLLLPFVYAMPKDAGGTAFEEALPKPPAPHRALSWPTISVVSAVFLVALMTASLWSFYYQLGARASLTPDQINATIASSAICAVLGSFLAAGVGSRLGHLGSLAVGVVGLSVATMLISMVPDPIAFRIGACLNLVALGFITPYFLGIAAAQDPTGRDSALVNSAFLLSGAVGPYMGGVLLETVGSNLIGWIVLVANSCAFLLFLSVSRRQRHERAHAGEPAADYVAAQSNA